MKSIIVRALSGAAYVGLIVASILLGDGRFFPVVCTLFALIAVMEYSHLCNPGVAASLPVRILDTALCVLPPAVLSLSSAMPSRYIYVVTLCGAITFACLLMVRVIYTLYSHEEKPVSSLAYSILGIGYIAVPLSMAALMSDRYTRYMLLLAFVMIWINDTGAFLTGTAFGRHRLCERLSPKKSWEGFFGGLLFSCATGLAAYLLLPVYFVQLTPAGAVALGVGVSVFATWGDLFESLLKRTAGVKDSGHIMPGHGGILDRIDSLLFVVPVLFALLFFL